jgi:hypothetical protein
MVRAIDAQHVILQSTMTEKVQQIQQQNPDMQQRYFALELSEQDRHLKAKVKDSEESEKSLIKEKQDHENERKNKKRNATDNPEALAQAEDGEDEGGLINIKV